MTDVRGGNTIVEGTRIGVHDAVGLIVNGSSIDDVVRSFPDLTRVGMLNADIRWHCSSALANVR